MTLKRWFLLAYVSLLATSHVVRAVRPDPLPASDQRVQRVAGSPARPDEPVAIAFREWGVESDDTGGPDPSSTERYPVLLLHGSPGSGSVFRRLAPGIAQQRPALAPDLPGFGASTRDVPDYSIRAHGEMTLQLLDSLGLERLHVVGFSLGGGVALEMYRMDPGRFASLTLLSSIGVQEHELLGDYHLNHAIHGLQLFGIWALTELVPHFGLVDDNFLSLPYARNFYDTDQRPLRGILTSVREPVLIIHGSDDPLVPRGAADEHHRLVPQSEMVMLDGDHFMTFLRPEVIAAPLASFFARVEAGQSLLRSDASPERVARAAVPFDPRGRPPATGFALLVTLLLIAAATFVSEDLTCIGTGLLIARGSLPWIPGTLACLVGIFVGDLLLYAGGRLVGRPVVSMPPMRWFIREEDLERSCRWFTLRSGALILWGRFVPGTRLPTYVAAGVVGMSVLLFAFWALVAAVLWTPLLVGATAAFGIAAAEWIQAFQDRAALWLLVMALAVLVGLRILFPLATQRGRSRARGRWERLRRWEFWPPWLFYAPVVVYVAWLAIRHRSATVFTAANPAIPDGGFVGESKAAILGNIGDPARVAATHLLIPGAGGHDMARAMELTDVVGGFPVVVKPDVGERGAGVAIVRDAPALVARLSHEPTPVVLQEYVPGVELGIFYTRMPTAPRGAVFGITEKRLPEVEGDGTRTVSDLIAGHERLRCQARLFERTLGPELDRVLEPGERLRLAELGNHCLGAEFRDGRHLATPTLTDAIDRMSVATEGFYFGRYDIRGSTIEDIQGGRFKVIELNGVSSEATDIYDSENSLREAYRTLFRQWSLAFAIGKANVARGARPTGLLRLVRLLFEHFRPSGARWAHTSRRPRSARAREGTALLRTHHDPIIAYGMDRRDSTGGSHRSPEA